MMIEKAYTSIICGLILLSLNICHASQRVVVAELTTNTSCSPCYYGNAALDQIADNYGSDELVIIRYHCWWPSAYDPFYRYNISENTARVNYYGADYAPHLRIDGTVDGGSAYNTWSNLINSETGVNSPLEISMDGYFDSDSRTGNVDIRIIATEAIGYSNLKLRIALTESDIYWSAPNGSRWHHQTFRDMIPNTSGIALTISQGDTLDFHQSFTCATALDYENCELVAFVQSDSGRRILQGAQLALADIQYMLLPFSLASPADDTVLADRNPNFAWHPSDDPDSGYAINYEVFISLNPGFTNVVTSGVLSDTFWLSPFELQNDSTYYWRVLASNGHAPGRYCNDVYNFLIDEGEVITSISAPGRVFLIADSLYNLELVIYNESYFDVAYVIADSSDILSFDTGAGVLQDFEADTIDVYLSTSGLPPGEYSDSIYIVTDHPSSNYLVVPVAFTIYVHGDANCDGDLIGSDVTYLVGYFRGVADPPCEPFLRADVNGDCSVIGSDVTYMVNYFRGAAGPPSPGDCD